MTLPDGDQVGSLSKPRPVLSATRPPPSAALTTWRSEQPPQAVELRTTSWPPLGDQPGLLSDEPPGLLIETSTGAAVPSTSTTQTLPPFAYASRVPSGDQTKAPKGTTGLASRSGCWLLPSALIR